MRYSKNAEFNGRCVRLVLLLDSTEVLFINDRGEFNIEPVGAPSYAQAIQMAKRRAEKEGVVLEVLGQQSDAGSTAITRCRRSFSNDDTSFAKSTLKQQVSALVLTAGWQPAAALRQESRGSIHESIVRKYLRT